ncbi:unnamed protein product [Penicillium egyptiacum]|uniref:Wax synthase domain-containing protein n=1 Tax=Penicillium egyptiacum TaxID=1303716 RepID=A0A9W4P666_9EURO|nr:unnamed protein product [Penicillium egyptiacum]
MECLWILATILFFQYLVSSISLACTARKSTSRKLCILSLLILAVFEIHCLSFLPGPELQRAVIAFSCIVKLLHFISIFLILQVEIHQLVQTVSGSFLTSLRAGLNCVTSTRGIGTPWEVISWPHCREPTKGQYIANAIIVLSWQYLALDFLNFGALKYFHHNWPDTLAAGAEFLNPKSTKEQLMARIPLSCILVANLRLLFAMIYGVLATVSVLLNFNSPKDWPPLFGSMRHLRTFSIRSFWGKYWHQLLRWPLVTISTYIRQRLSLCNSVSRHVQSMTDLFLIFCLSGFLHLLSAVYAGVPDSLGAIFLFFITVPLLIMLEDAYRVRVGGTTHSRRMDTLGFLWALAWLYACVPWFAYTALRLPVNKNAMMPFSFVESFGSQAVMTMVLSGGIIWALWVDGRPVGEQEVG